ncbi:actin-related protein ARPC3 [Heliocybe sulcata]|uniref:Actin-related protein 2/3 complex subunit 3 n=1 Tax=Heliocybe sulcata TaxID=5364 RepID=A0A5C3NF96_9AGAM|nr:actin-related protein ARPC3 [Heliocybe sulcata]
MPAYHSSFNESPDMQQVGNLAVLPVKTKVRGPAPLADANSADIIDESIDLFRANSLFRNFEIKGPADRLLIILILFISDCLAKIGSTRTPPSQIEATKSLNTLSVDNFPIPGDANFPLNAHYGPPGNRQEADFLRQYLVQVRQEMAARMVERLYADGTGQPNKWWMSFQKRRFMNRSLA